MAKKRKLNKNLSYNPIPDFETDWMCDPTNDDKQFAGEPVQRFIKDELQKSAGYSRMEGSIMQFFRSADDADRYDADRAANAALLLSATDISGKASVVFRFAELQPSGGTLYVNSGSTTLIRIRFTAKQVDSEGEETVLDERANLSISVTRNGQTTTTPLGTIAANTDEGVYETVNVTPYISNGASFILTAYDDQGNSRTSPRFNVSASTLSVEPRTADFWATPYAESDETFRIPLRLAWNVACQLTATLTKDGTEYSRTVVGSAGNTLTANYDLTLPHPTAAITPGGSGIYHLRVELAATDEELGGLSDSFESDILCLADGDTGSNVIVNNIASSVENYATARLFDYAAHIGEGNHTLALTASVGGTAIATTGDLALENGTVQSYSVALEEERNSTEPFDVVVTGVMDGTTAAFDPITIEATNTTGYAATGGASLLIKTAGRSNSETARTTMKNLATGATVTPTYTGMSWSAGDGFHAVQHTDRLGNELVEMTALRLTGGTTMTVNEQFLKMSASQGRTFEMLFQPLNVLNEDTPVITIATDDATKDGGFVGLKVTSSRITLLTAGAQNTDNQSVGYDNSRPLHLAVVVYPGYNEAEGSPYNACFIFINGQKQREFAYSRDLNVAAPLVCSSEDATLDIFAVRAYNKALTTQEIEANAVNWQLSQEDKADLKARCDIRENGRVSFAKVQSMCNVFVFKSADGTGAIPRFGMAKGDKIHGTLRTYWLGNSSWNKSIDCDAEGQGTTSMQYWRWNFKSSFSEAVDFDGGTHPAIKKLTAKKNFASSMQSHKMGGTEAYDYLARACGAVEQDADRQAVWQYPFVGFAEDGNGNLTFIGLYTVGPDKGDTNTFGFVKNQTVAMEGLDNEPLSTNFLMPWNDATVSVDSDGEKYTVGGEKAWEDSMKNTAGVAARWKPAYNLVYECSQNIAPWKGATLDGTTYPATSEGLIAYGAALETAPTTEYWIATGQGDAYDLYRYDRVSSGFVRAGVTADLNLATQLCGRGYVIGTDTSGGTATDILLTTAVLAAATVPAGSPAGYTADDERNRLFQLARQSKFRKEMEQHWNKRNAFFKLGHTEFTGGTDGLTKNTYPYLLDYTNPDARWSWREDDIDTIIDIDNQGKDKKLYCVEIEDNYTSYGGVDMDVFNGRNNQFWLLVRTAFATEYAEFMRTVFIPALNIAPALGVLAGTLKFFDRYYFSRAQEYFGPALYNADSTYSYESAYGAGASAYTTHHAIALSQLLGDHYSAEKRWIRLRTVYMMSKYSCGLFTASATQDAFANRVAAGTNQYTLTPAIYMYPSIANGNTLMRGDRIWPGTQQTTHTFTVTVEGSDQQVLLLGMSYLSSVGNLYEDTLTGALTIYGPMLRTLAVGNRDSEGTLRSAAVTAIAIGSARSLRTLDVSRLANVTGALDLSSCESLQTLYALGSGISSLMLPDGAPVETLVLPATLQGLTLSGLKRLASLSLAGTAAITAIAMDGCSDYAVNQTMAMLADSTLQSRLQSVCLAFGEASSPTILTDAQITTLLALGGSAIETKQFSGYITKATGVISGSTWISLNAMGITYVGGITPEVIVSSQDVTIVNNAATVYSGDSATFRASVAPTSAGTPRFRLYNGDTPIAEDAQGIATYNGTSLNCATGQLTTTAVNTAFPVKVSAYVGNGADEVESRKVTLTIERIVVMGGFTLTGTKAFTQTGNSTLAITPTNAGYTVAVDSVNATLTYNSGDAGADDYLRVTLTSLENLQLLAAVLAIPSATRQYTLTVTDVKGNTYTETETLTVQSIPVASFSLSGDAEITATGSYAYTIADILPANHNRGIASLAASVTVPTTGSIAAAVPAGSPTGVTLTVTTRPDATETVTLTVTATLTGGGTVTATKQISLKVAAAGGDFVDLGLPSGTFWAKGNIVKDGSGNYSIGNETDYGAYFSWGNVEGHNDGEGYDFRDSTYNSTPGKSVSADISSSDATHDAALATLGSPCRMPTKEEFKELYDNTDNELTTIGGVSGRKFMKKTNNRVYVFFPASGYYNGTSPYTQGSYGYYWSSSWHSYAHAYGLSFTPGNVYPQDSGLCHYGKTLRAVQ